MGQSSPLCLFLQVAADGTQLLGVSFKTAWFLCHRIRAALKDADTAPSCGIVEVDETYVGGKTRGKGKGYKGNKAIVLAAIQRGRTGPARRGAAS